MKRLVVFVLTILLFLVVTVPVGAEGEVEPEYVVVCPDHGMNHHMYPYGMAAIRDYNTNNFIFNGHVFYCSCSAFIATEGSPIGDVPGIIGSYVTSYVNVSEWYNGVWTFWVDPSNVRYTWSSTLPGYAFYWYHY